MRSKSLCIAILALFFSFFASAQARPSPEADAVPTYPDVAYGTVEGVPLLLDIYVPAGAGPYPLVLWIHGGGWVAGEKGPMDEGFIQFMFDSGMAFASMEYRLTLDDRFEEKTFPAQVNDVKGAIRFLRARSAEYNLDPNRIIVWGSSAGGHLAALAGTSGGVAELEGTVGGNLDRSSRVLGAVDYSGPSCMESLALSDPWTSTPDGPLSLLFGHPMMDIIDHWEDTESPYPRLRALVESAGPVHHVDPSDSLFLIAHGEEDTVVSVLQSDQLAGLLLEAGVPCEYYRVPDSGHEGTGFPWLETIAFFQSSFARPALVSDFSFEPLSPTDNDPVTFSASASAGKPPYSYAWDICGTTAEGETATMNLSPGICTIKLTVTDSAGAEVTTTKTVDVGYSITITGASWTANPGRLKISGAGFEQGCAVKINGAAAPKSLYKNPGHLVARGGGLKAMLPKGIEVQVQVVSSDGRSSAPFIFTR
jgi:acetyl esterase/lipase